MEIENAKCRYIMLNNDEYIVSKEDGKWLLHIIDKEHPSGKFITRNKDINKIFERIPEDMV